MNISNLMHDLVIPLMLAAFAAIGIRVVATFIVIIMGAAIDKFRLNREIKRNKRWREKI